MRETKKEAKAAFIARLKEKLAENQAKFFGELAKNKGNYAEALTMVMRNAKAEVDEAKKKKKEGGVADGRDDNEIAACRPCVADNP